jgi:dipeptidyl aminopeptidase/acylaminoacyl peptidase
MSSTFHDDLEQEYGGKPHARGIMDMLWERSPIRFVHRVKSPVLLIHDDNDMLVDSAEVEQFFVALEDLGVETVMVRYPREGHSIRETQRWVDLYERSIAWCQRHFNNVVE